MSTNLILILIISEVVIKVATICIIIKQQPPAGGRIFGHTLAASTGNSAQLATVNSCWPHILTHTCTNAHLLNPGVYSLAILLCLL